MELADPGHNAGDSLDVNNGLLFLSLCGLWLPVQGKNMNEHVSSIPIPTPACRRAFLPQMMERCRDAVVSSVASRVPFPIQPWLLGRKG